MLKTKRSCIGSMGEEMDCVEEFLTCVSPWPDESMQDGRTSNWQHSDVPSEHYEHIYEAVFFSGVRTQSKKRPVGTDQLSIHPYLVQSHV